MVEQSFPLFKPVLFLQGYYGGPISPLYILSSSSEFPPAKPVIINPQGTPPIEACTAQYTPSRCDTLPVWDGCKWHSTSRSLLNARRASTECVASCGSEQVKFPVRQLAQAILMGNRVFIEPSKYISLYKEKRLESHLLYCHYYYEVFCVSSLVSLLFLILCHQYLYTFRKLSLFSNKKFELHSNA